MLFPLGPGSRSLVTLSTLTLDAVDRYHRSPHQDHRDKGQYEERARESEREREMSVVIDEKLVRIGIVSIE